MMESNEFHDILEYPWVKNYIAFMRPSVIKDMLNSEMVFSKKLPNFVKNQYPKIKGLTLVDPFRLGKIVDLIIETKDIEGDIVECGSYKGGTGILIGILLKELGISKKVHLFDSFEGLPEPDSIHDSGYKKGQFLSNFEDIQKVIKLNNLSDTLVLHKGWFSDTVEEFFKSSNSLSCLHIDCDLYNSTMDCLPHLFPLLNKGGAVILDDYNDGGKGEKIAVHEFLNTHNITQYFIPTTAPQCYFLKDMTESGPKVKIDNAFFVLKELREHKQYISWLDSSIEENYGKMLKTITNYEK